MAARVALNETKKSSEIYFPPSESEGGWRAADPLALGIDPDQLKHAIQFHDDHEILTREYGGALLIIYQGHMIGESYITGTNTRMMNSSGARC